MAIFARSRICASCGKRAALRLRTRVSISRSTSRLARISTAPTSPRRRSWRDADIASGDMTAARRPLLSQKSFGLLSIAFAHPSQFGQHLFQRSAFRQQFLPERIAHGVNAGRGRAKHEHAAEIDQSKPLSLLYPILVPERFGYGQLPPLRHLYGCG